MISICFPRHCPVCGGVVKCVGENREDEVLICTYCRETLQYVSEPYCMKCGKPLADREKLYCFDCEDKRKREIPSYYERGVALFTYQSAGKGLLDVKYHNRREYAAFYGREAARRYGSLICRDWKPDVIVPVPVHVMRRWERGYNQAELYGAEISNALGIPMRSRLLVRTKRTTAQKKLRPEERLMNLNRAFMLGEPVTGIRSVLLVDDVYTTGSTIEANARVLRKAGVERVYFLAMAIGTGRQETL